MRSPAAPSTPPSSQCDVEGHHHGEIEKEYILAVLELNGGNRTRTAEQLGIGSATLYRKLKSYGLIRGRRADQR